MHRPFVRLCIALLASGTAAAGADTGDLYALGAIGGLTYSGSAQADLDAGLTASGVTGLQSSMGTSSTGFKLALGYQVNRNLAVEGGYVDMGAFKYSASSSGGWVTSDVTGYGFNLSALGIAPVNNQLSAFGKVGYTLANQKSSVNGAGGSASLSENKNSVGFGVGGIYQLTPSLSVRAEWEKLYQDVSLISFGLQAKF